MIEFGPSVTLRVTDGVGVVTVDNAPVNAMSQHVLDGLAGAAEYIQQNDTVRTVVVTGVGTKAFMAGADITEFESLLAEEGGVARHSASARHTFDLWSSLDQPVIAAVQASAVGGGLEFALLCDIIVTDPAAVFGLTEVKLGLIPGGGGTQRLPGRIGKSLALEMMLTGSVVKAARARELGLVNRIAEPGEALPTAHALAAKIAAQPWVAVRNIKRAANVQGSDLSGNLDQERALFFEAFASDDLREGMSAFLAKRQPVFSHR